MIEEYKDISLDLMDALKGLKGLIYDYESEYNKILESFIFYLKNEGKIIPISFSDFFIWILCCLYPDRPFFELSTIGVQPHHFKLFHEYKERLFNDPNWNEDKERKYLFFKLKNIEIIHINQEKSKRVNKNDALIFPTNLVEKINSVLSNNLSDNLHLLKELLLGKNIGVKLDFIGQSNQLADFFSTVNRGKFTTDVKLAKWIVVNFTINKNTPSYDTIYDVVRGAKPITKSKRIGTDVFPR